MRFGLARKAREWLAARTGDEAEGLSWSKNTSALIVSALVLMSLVAIYLVWFRPPEVSQWDAFGVIELPGPKTVGTMSVEEAILRRRSIRNYANKPLSLEDISQLVWAAQGITDAGQGFRSAPSAGALYPLEIYVVVGANGVTGLADGVYHYDPEGHRLEGILMGDLRSRLADAALGQSPVREAPVCIVIAAVYERTTIKYGERGIRYVHIEAGHVGQNLYLQAVARGLGMVVIGAFQDDLVQSVLSLPAEQKPLYIVPVGYPA